jgi:pilus assembly protein CpaF
VSPGLVDRVRQQLVDGASLGAAVHAEHGGIADDAVLSAARREVEAELRGAGPLEPVLALPGVTDVLVNAPDEVWFERGRGLERAAVRLAGDDAVRRLAQRLAAQSGQRLDDAAPIADVALPDGTRLNAVLPPLVAHPTLSLRVLARERRSLDDIVALGAMPPAVAAVLRAVVRSRVPFVVSGGTGTGKTTLLGALLAEVDAGERLVLIEDSRELVVPHPHVVRMVTRSANVEGAGAIGLRDLVRTALRMRPDRLVVGEFRGAEMVELLVALNSGHEGGAATLHANSAADLPGRFVALGLLGGLPPAAVTSLVASALRVAVHLRRGRDGRRRVEEIALITAGSDGLATAVAWSRHRPAPAVSSLAALVDAPVPP